MCSINRYDFNIVLTKIDRKFPSMCVKTKKGGFQFGLQLGLERVDDILLLHDDAALRLFSEKDISNWAQSK